MVAILQDLHEEDHFGILLFEHKISYWKDYLTKQREMFLTPLTM